MLHILIQQAPYKRKLIQSKQHYRVTTGPLTCTSLTCTSQIASGNATFNSLSENLIAITSGTNAFTLNYNAGSVFYLSTGSTLSANFTIQLNNCSTTTTNSKVFTLIYAATGKYYCSGVTAYSDSGTTAITLS